MNRHMKCAVLVALLVLIGSISWSADRVDRDRPERATSIKPAVANETPPQSATTPSAKSTPKVIPAQAGGSTREPSGALQNPSTGEQIKWQVLSSAGGRTASANYKVDLTVGQTAAGVVTSPSFKLRQGFWQQYPTGCCAALTGNVDCDPADGTDISDLSRLIDFLYISFTPLCCEGEANTDGQPGTDISDLSALIDYLYISFTPPAVCL